MLLEQRKEPRTDREQINVDNVDQRRLWCERLDCTESELRSGVKAAGSTVEVLRLHLRIRRSVRAAIRYGRISP